MLNQMLKTESTLVKQVLNTFKYFTCQATLLDLEYFVPPLFQE